jgi:hypothetical protein
VVFVVLLQAIALIRPHDKPGFYNGSWIDPQYVANMVTSRGCYHVADKAGFGGKTKVYHVRDKTSIIQVCNAPLLS